MANQPDEVFKMKPGEVHIMTAEEMQDMKCRAVLKMAKADWQGGFPVIEGDRITFSYTVRIGDDKPGDCGAILHGVNPIPPCHHKAGHTGDHCCVVKWPNEHHKEISCSPS